MPLGVMGEQRLGQQIRHNNGVRQIEFNHAQTALAAVASFRIGE